MSEEFSVKAKISVDTSEAEVAYKQFSATLDGVAEGADKATSGIGKMAAGVAIGNALTKAFGAVKNALGGAISRVDTLNNYNKVMESLGYSTEQAQRSQDKLSESINGLPTTLDEIVSNTQQLTASMGDLDQATDVAVALNDMFNAGGQGAEAASRAFTQYNQMIAKGKVDMQSWMSVVQTAPAQVDALAKTLLGATANQTDLYNALQQGTVSMNDLNAAVVRLDTEGGEGIASFHDQALTATDGIGTGIKNLKSAITKGVAKFIDETNKALAKNGLPSISEQLTALKGVINKVFGVIAKVVGKIIDIVGRVVNFVKKNANVVIPVLATVASGFAALIVVNKIKSWTESASKGIGKLILSFAKLLAGQTATTAALGAQAAAEGADTAAKGAQTTATLSAASAQEVLNKAIAANPLGIMIAAATALTAALVGLFSWLGNNTEAAKEAAAEAEKIDARRAELAGVSEKHDGTVKDIRKSWKETVNGYTKETKAAEIVEDVNEHINSAVKERNSILEDIEDNERKHKSAKKEITDLEARIQVEKDRLKWSNYSSSQELRLMEETLSKKQDLYNEEEAALNDLYTQREQANYLIEELYKTEADAVKQSVSEQMTAEEQLKEAEHQYNEWKKQSIQEQLGVYERVMDNLVALGRITYDQLSEQNQALVDDLKEKFGEYSDAATNMFDKLSNEFDGTAQDVIQSQIDILNNNQAVVAQMGEHMQQLRDYFETAGLDQAVLDQIDSMGVEGAQYAAAAATLIAQGYDDELSEWATTFANGFDVAGEAVADSMGTLGQQKANEVKQLWTEGGDSVYEILRNTDWTEIPQKWIDDMISGFDKTDEAQSKAKELGYTMGDSAIEGADESLQSGSPSKQFENRGIWSIQGYENGVVGETPGAVAKVKSMVLKVVNEAGQLSSRMYSVGVNTMQGFINGLSAMSGRVISVAQSIANSVSSTISRALEVGSPSRLLKRIGIFTGEGLVKGLDAMGRAVEAASQRLSEASTHVFLNDIGSFSDMSYSLAMDGGSFNMELPNDLAELKDAIMNQPIEVATELVMDGERMGYANAKYNRMGINAYEKAENYRKGLR